MIFHFTSQLCDLNKLLMGNKAFLHFDTPGLSLSVNIAMPDT
jgi:hypothetical protein